MMHLVLQVCLPYNNKQAVRRAPPGIGGCCISWGHPAPPEVCSWQTPTWEVCAALLVSLPV